MTATEFAAKVLRAPLWPHQQELADSTAFISAVAAARRTGKTQACEVLAMHTAFSRRECKVLILSAGQANLNKAGGEASDDRSRSRWGAGHTAGIDHGAPTCDVARMTDPASAPWGAVRLADVAVLSDIDPDNPEINDGDFHLVRRHFDVRAFGVNAIRGNAGDELVEPHHELDDEVNRTNGHEELFAVIGGHAIFTVDGEEVDAPPGTLVFVRDPGLIRSARAAADGTALLAVGGPAGRPFEVSRWEMDLP